MGHKGPHLVQAITGWCVAWWLEGVVVAVQIATNGLEAIAWHDLRKYRSKENRCRRPVHSYGGFADQTGQQYQSQELHHLQPVDISPGVLECVLSVRTLKRYLLTSILVCFLYQMINKSICQEEFKVSQWSFTIHKHLEPRLASEVRYVRLPSLAFEL